MILSGTTRIIDYYVFELGITVLIKSSTIMMILLDLLFI